MTPATIWHLDTSAAAKLVWPEPGTGALRRWLRNRRWILSALHRAELRRAARRAGGRAPARADRLLAAADLLRVDAPVFDAAGRLAPAGLRSLDALHVAAAQLLGNDLAGLVADDTRILAAAREVGLDIAHPGVRLI